MQKQNLGKFKVVASLAIFGVMAVVGVFGVQNFASASLINASDVLGQLDQNNASTFTQSSPNSSFVNSIGFAAPASIVVDETNHRIFLADRNNHRVLVFKLDPNSNKLEDLIADYVLGQADFHSNLQNGTGNSSANARSFREPIGLAYDSTRNHLFVTDFQNSRVLVFDVSTINNNEDAVDVIGQADFTSGNSGTSATRLKFPQGLVYDSKNDLDPSNDLLFIADAGNNRVVAVSIVNKNFVEVLGQANFIQGQNNRGGAAPAANTMYSPMSLSIKSDLLFVADRFNNRVLVFDIATIDDDESAMYVLGQDDFDTSAGTLAASSKLSSPSGVFALDNKLFVSQSNPQRVMVFDITTIENGEAAVSVLGQPNFDTGVFSGLPTNNANFSFGSYSSSMAYLSNQNLLFIVDGGNNRVLAFDIADIVNGEAAEYVLGQVNAVGQSTFSQNKVNSSFISEHGFDFNTDFSNRGQNGIDLDPINHKLFVADANNNRVLIFDLNNSNVLLDFNADYVLGQSNFTANAENRGNNNPTANTLRTPGDVLFDATSNMLYVADTINHRVLAYNIADGITNGEDAAKVLGQNDFVSRNTGRTASTLNGPRALVIDRVSNRLFVADTGNARILAYNLSDGITDGEGAINVLGQNDFTSFSLDSIGPARLNRPTALEIGNSKLFVADYNNNRILVFDITDIVNGEDAVNVLGQGGFDTNSSNYNGAGANAPSAASLSGPIGISYNEQNNVLYVTVSGNHRVLAFDLAEINNGENAIAVLGQTTFTRGFFNSNSTVTANAAGFGSPSSITIGPDTNLLYIVDAANHRILSFYLVDLLPTIMPDGVVGALYSQAINPAVNNKGTVTYTVTGLPDGLLFNENAMTVEGAPTTAGTFAFTITAKDTLANGEFFIDSQEFNLEVAGFELPPTVLPNAIIGGTYNQNINPAINGQGDVIYAVTAGNFPVWLELNKETGNLRGDVSGDVATYQFTITADDGTSQASQDFTLNVAELTLPPTVLPSGVIGAPYDQIVNAAINVQGDVTYNVIGILPDGLVFDPLTRVISGNPTMAGTFNFSIQAMDSFMNGNGPNTANAEQVYRIIVDDGQSISLPFIPLADGTVGIEYNQNNQLIPEAVNPSGNVTYTISASADPAFPLPAWLDFDLATRLLSGVPGQSGEVRFVITVADESNESDSKEYSIHVDLALDLPSTVLPNEVVGQNYNQVINPALNIRGAATYRIVNGSLPNGLAFDPATRVISGIPTTAGTFNFTIAVVDKLPNNIEYTDGQDYSITILPALSLPATVLPNGAVGTVYNQTLNPAVNVRGNVTYTLAGNLPNGLAFDAGARVISGNPTASGIFNFSVTAKDTLPDGTFYTDVENYSITIDSGLSLPASVLPNGIVGTAYNQTINAAVNGQGAVAYAVTVDNLPNGLALDSATRVISGNPTVAGTFNFTITATDASNFTDSENFTIIINAAPVAPPVGGGGGGGGGGGSPAFNAPVGGFSVTVDSVVTGTNPVQVNLKLNGGTATRMAIANTPDFAGVGQQVYRTTTVHTLTAGNGPKTVYARFFDSFGTASPVVSATVNITGNEGVVTLPAVVGEVLGEKITRLDELVAKLKAGQTSNEVMELQAELKKAGYFAKTWKPTRFYGKLTSAAVKKYLATKNKAPVAVKTLDELVVTLKFGQKSDLVKQLQTELKKLKFLPAKHVVTSYYGQITKTAVQKYIASQK